MLNYIPVSGWIISFIFSVFIAIPLFFLWNWLAPVYLSMLPPLYLDIPFSHVVGLCWLASILKTVLLPRFTPIALSSNNSVGQVSKKSSFGL